ncbi:MAG: UDP-2,3-diacylglucosamine diphosphatase, partial [Asticcacaulis sp.]
WPERPSVQDIYAGLSSETGGDPGDELLHPVLTCRAVFLSDIHIGTPGCRAADVVAFLNHVKADFVYWNGDIFDLWHLHIFAPAGLGKLLKQGSLNRAQLTLIQKILREDRRGTRQVFIPGNHDEAFRALIGEGFRFGNRVLVMFDAVHETARGQRFLVMHGDAFDAIVHNHRWLGILGTSAFGWLAAFSLHIDRLRSRVRLFNGLLEALGLDRHWSLAARIKARADGAAYGASFEQAMLGFLFHENAARVRRGAAPYTGIICGHTHVAGHKLFNSPLQPMTGEPIGPRQVHYFNTGHWTGRPVAEGMDIDVDDDRTACTALVEHSDGRMELVRWDRKAGIVVLEENGP